MYMCIHEQYVNLDKTLVYKQPFLVNLVYY